MTSRRAIMTSSMLLLRERCRDGFVDTVGGRRERRKKLNVVVGSSRRLAAGSNPDEPYFPNLILEARTMVFHFTSTMLPA